MVQQSGANLRRRRNGLARHEITIKQAIAAITLPSGVAGEAFAVAVNHGQGTSARAGSAIFYFKNPD